MTVVQTGLDMLLNSPPEWIAGRRLGLLCNPASVDGALRHSRHLIHQRFPGQLRALFSPQHGFFAEKQDNMIESDHLTDPDLHIPIFSLYGDTRWPTSEMMAPIDILLVDLQDVGTRVYTFIYTLSYCLEAAREIGKKVVVLDRPNPIDGVSVEGNCVASDCTSFVGRYPIPMRHGLTMGEIALLFNGAFGIDSDLTVIAMQNWRRPMHFHQTGLPWVAPSPNMPSPATALVYQGQVIWEGTNISEGRGTTQPFEFFGAPFLDDKKIQLALPTRITRGAVLRPLVFEPTSGKWAGHPCRGFQIHVTDPQQYRPYLHSLTLLQRIIQQNNAAFRWKSPPYEYEFNRWPIDLIIGSKDIRKHIEQGGDLNEVREAWQPQIEEFLKLRQDFLLYPDE